MDTVAVQMTGRGVGAIAVVLVAGGGAEALVVAMSKSQRAKSLAVGQSVHTVLQHSATGQPLDDVMVVRVAENEFELHLHGGIAVISAVLGALADSGATVLTLEEAMQRGILGEGLSGEASLALAGAHTLSAARLLAAQSHEGIAGVVEKWLAWLPGKTANDLWRLHSAIQWLLIRSAALDRLIHSARIAIIGPPNAGKSTLANALLGRPVSITSDIAGTTRDWVDAQAVFVAADVAVPVTLIDTAGLRATHDTLEQQSIARSHEQASGADLLLLVFDASAEPVSDQLQLFKAYAHQRMVVVANKIDAGRAGLPAIQQQNARTVEVSAKTHAGLEQLMQTVLEELDLAEISPTEPFAFTDRQHRLLSEIATASDPPRTADLLRQIKG